MLTASELRELSAIQPYRSASQIFVEVISIAAAVWICESWWNPGLYILTVIWIGARQHGLAVLMHDSAHGRLFPNRKINDWVGELLVWPLFITMHGFRKSHLAHHQFLGTEKDPDLVYWRDDPDFRFPMPSFHFFHILICSAIGLKTLEQFKMILGYFFSSEKSNRSNSSDQRDVQIARLCFYGIALLLCGYFGLWRGLFLYWVVPSLTWLTTIFYFRAAIEHYALDGKPDQPLRATRTWVTGPLERLLIVPNGIQYHIEHHLYPSVPFHRLPELRRRLMAIPEYRETAHQTYGLVDVFREMTRL